ncbi:mRNA processing protein, putative [Plasmodium relictum]|uniref:mRNA processing protein, putative n=1 Tax=Plasmodium relictum TaxID=85471 RepID=A0A1J1H7Z1_PLARL|nr:mRNA processing protein, putative [Plasmodium relictum]CRG99544.1 mRNA processing protein, putative [Plasmodium relictum]
MSNKNNYSLWIGNIPFDVTEKELHEILSKVGDVINVRIKYDIDKNVSKGFAFCEYKDLETCMLALKYINGYEIKGRKLKLYWANEEFKEKINNNAKNRSDKRITKNSHKLDIIDVNNKKNILSSYIKNDLIEKDLSANEIRENNIRINISNIIHTLTTSQIIYILSYFQKYSIENFHNLKIYFQKNGNVAYALLHCLFILNIINDYSITNNLNICINNETILNKNERILQMNNSNIKIELNTNDLKNINKMQNKNKEENTVFKNNKINTKKDDNIFKNNKIHLKKEENDSLMKNNISSFNKKNYTHNLSNSSSKMKISNSSSLYAKKNDSSNKYSSKNDFLNYTYKNRIMNESESPNISSESHNILYMNSNINSKTQNKKNFYTNNSLNVHKQNNEVIDNKYFDINYMMNSNNSLNEIVDFGKGYEPDSSNIESINNKAQHYNNNLVDNNEQRNLYPCSFNDMTRNNNLKGSEIVDNCHNINEMQSFNNTNEENYNLSDIKNINKLNEANSKLNNSNNFSDSNEMNNLNINKETNNKISNMNNFNDMDNINITTHFNEMNVTNDHHLINYSMVNNNNTYDKKMKKNFYMMKMSNLPVNNDGNNNLMKNINENVINNIVCKDMNQIQLKRSYNNNHIGNNVDNTFINENNTNLSNGNNNEIYLNEIYSNIELPDDALVNEVIKNTDILNNILKSKIEDMKNWNNEQKIQVLSIQKALLLKGYRLK